MNYLLDTNHCIYLMNGWNSNFDSVSDYEKNTIDAYNKNKNSVIYMSEASVGELWYSVLRSQRKNYNQDRLEILIKAVPPLPINQKIWKLYGQTKADLSKIGKIVPDIDLVIAATAKEYCMTLVANDKHMKQLPASFLRKNWATGEI